MAGQVLSVVVDGVIANAMSLASEHISSVWGLKEEIGKLQVSLTKIQALLHDAEKKQLHDESVKIWLRQLKDVAYEADDVLDEYDYEILRRKVETQNQVRSFFSSSNPVVFPVKMAKRIKTINQSLDEIKNDIPLLGLIASWNPIPQTGLDRETDSFIDGSEVVGRRHDVSEIVKLLIGANNQVISVIPIVGMAGLGKTTVAKLVYNHELVKKHFDEKIWVCVSENFDVKRILREILEALDHNCSGLENKNAILQHLQKKLQGKRYLLILDDVWDEDREKWDSLRSSLLGINQNNGNNILVTTRKDNVAQIMKTSLIHKLEKLSEDECWLIFKEKTFANERIPVTPDLEDIGRKIAKRCGGNPLAARVLGGMMRLKEDKSEWLLIQNSKTWDSMEDNNGVFPILKLSFDHLPTPSLKQCFAYCSIFPKDFIIEKKLLVELWMAEGFLQTSKRRFLEDIGNKYFDFLVANSLFQDLERDFYGGIRSCKMHDLVHDLALLISEGETLHLEENLGDDIDVSHTRRLSLTSDGQTTPTIPLSEDGMGRLRTVFLNRVDLGDKLLEFKCVRGLSLSGSCIKELPESIGKLIHLRLLRIKDTYINLIPNSVTMLYNLQTLVIKNCRFLKELPKDLQKLINLRHIDIDHDYIKQLPINMGQLTCLQTLPFFAIGQDVGCRIKELGCLSQLKEELCIYNLEHVRDKEEAKTANLAVKSKVNKLGFYWGWYGGEGNNNKEDVLEGLQPHPNLKSLEIENFDGEKFPSWLLGSDNIRGGLLLFDHLLEICLSYCEKCEKLPTLGHLPNLKVLKIVEMDNVRCIGTEFYGNFNGEVSSNSRGGSGSTVLFPALETLALNSMHNLVEWTEPTAEIGMIFPRLKHLTVWECEKLTSAPRHFPFIKWLSVYKIRGLAFENIIKELTTLTSLDISEISELACLPEHFLQKNKSLENLRVGECADLESILPHERVWPICTSLRSLSIYGSDKLSTFPAALHNLQCLEKIKVYCPNLRSFPSIQGITSSLQHLWLWCSVEVLPTGLQSCVSLQNLFIWNCSHLMSIPDLRNLHSLTHLAIDNCPNLKSIPDLKELPSLTQLKILYCSNLKSIPDLKELPSLTRLKISDCSNLIPIPVLKELPSLTHLEIYSCSNLISIPDVKELPSLTLLNISGCPNLISIPDMRELPSLTHLEIRDFQKLRCVPNGLDFLTRLKCLRIGGFCKELNTFPSLNFIQRSHAPLEELHLYGWASLYSLPEEIQFFTAVKILNISEFDKINSLPDWLGNLSSIQKLYIYNCKNMMYLPTTQAMRRLIKLEQLSIWECPKLEERCAEGSGTEWSKIAHIPEFSSTIYHLQPLGML